MDGEISEDNELLESSSKKLTYAEYFKEWFPFYLNCGMNYSQYWEQDSALVIPYLAAYTLRRDEQNYFAWLQGFYNYVGFSAVMANFGAGLAGKHANENYLKEPAQIRPKTEEEVEAEKEQKRRKFVAALNKFHARMEAKNAGKQCD